MRALATAGCAFLFTVAVAVSADKRPEKYPSVGLEPDSQPLYVPLAVDAWQGETAYLLFDGTSKNGYKRLYVWIPDDRKYGKPVELKADTEGNFGSFDVSSSSEKEKSEVKWTLAQRKQSHGGGTSTRTDYVTGKAVTTTSKAWSGYQLLFSVDFAWGPKEAMATMTKGLPLDLTVSGQLGGQGQWDKVAASGFAPWQSLHVAIGVQPVNGKDSARVLFKSGNLSYNNGRCVVRSVPKDPEISLVVAPYMEANVYSNALVLGELMQNGVEVDLPYGWYVFRSAPFECGKFRYPVGIPAMNLSPYPLTRPAATGGS